MRVKFDEQLKELHVELIKMGSLCEEAISLSAKALEGGPEAEALARKVSPLEYEIDQKEREIEGRCMRLLLQQQPVATDLRIVSAALRMISDLERIGDQAADIAELTPYITEETAQKELPISQMARCAVSMVTGSVDAFVREDLDLARKIIQEDDQVDAYFSEIKEELIQFGYIKRHYSGKKGNKKVRINSKPFHYISSDGFHMYVGKNNFQNEELTFKFATGNDWWFHAKGIPGSHVIVKSEGQELPDRTFEEAGRLAAYYSKGRDAEKVEIDYIQKKQVKKTPGGKPGFLIYHTNYSLLIDPDIRNIQQVK